MSKGTLLLYTEWAPLISSLPDEKRLKLFDLLMDFHNSNDTKIEDPHLKSVFDFISMKIRENEKKYNEKCEKAKQAIEKRWSKTDDKNVPNGIKENTDVYGRIHKDKDKDKDKDIIISKEINIYTFWNSKKIIEHKLLTDDMKKQIAKQLLKFSEEEIKQAITNYSDILKDQDCFFKFKWTLSEFLTRVNGMPVFLDKRPEDYKTRSAKPKKMEEYQKPDARENFEFFTPEEEAKYGGVQTQ